MKSRLTLAFVLSVGTFLTTCASAASPDISIIVLPGLGDTAIPYPESRSESSDDQRSLDKISDSETLRWLASIGQEGVDQSEDLIMVIDENSKEWRTIDASSVGYTPDLGNLPEPELGKNVDLAVETIAEIIAILMEFLNLSFAEAAELLDELLQHRDLDELETMFNDVENSWDVTTLILIILEEAADESSDDVSYYRDLTVTR